MTSEQIALIIALLIGLIPNVVLKLLDKYKSKDEVADLQVDSLSETLKEMREHNKFLEEKLASKREEITVQNKLLYDLNSQNVLLTQQISKMTDEILDITAKLQECVRCVEKLNNKEA